MRLRGFRYPLARALAAWIKPLMASTEPLLRALSKLLRIPSQWVFRVRASFLKGDSLLRRAHRNHAVSRSSASARVVAAAKMGDVPYDVENRASGAA